MPHGPKVFESLSLRERLQTLTGWEIWFHYFFLWNIVWYEDIPNNIILLYIYYIILYYISQTWFHNCSYWWIWASNPLFPQETLGREFHVQNPVEKPVENLVWTPQTWRMSDQQTKRPVGQSNIRVFF